MLLCCWNGAGNVPGRPNPTVGVVGAVRPDTESVGLLRKTFSDAVDAEWCKEPRPSEEL